MNFLSLLAGIHAFTSVIPGKGELQMLTSTLNLQVTETIYTVTWLAFSSKLLNIASSKQNCNTNTKPSKLMTTVYLFVMLLCAMGLGPHNQDQPFGMGAVNQVLHTRIKEKKPNNRRTQKMERSYGIDHVKYIYC